MARLRLCEGDVGTDSVLMRVCTVLSASLLYTVPPYTLEMEGASVVRGQCTRSVLTLRVYILEYTFYMWYYLVLT